MLTPSSLDLLLGPLPRSTRCSSSLRSAIDSAALDTSPLLSVPCLRVFWLSLHPLSRKRRPRPSADGVDGARPAGDAWFDARVEIAREDAGELAFRVRAKGLRRMPTTVPLRPGEKLAASRRDHGGDAAATAPSLCATARPCRGCASPGEPSPHCRGGRSEWQTRRLKGHRPLWSRAGSRRLSRKTRFVLSFAASPRPAQL